MSTKKSIFRIFLVLIAVLLMSSTVSARPLADALGTSFSYQGRLTDAGLPANGTYDFEFKLFDALTDGVLVGTDPLEDVIVSGGLFTVQLDFGAVFDGRVLYLDIGVRPGASTGAYTLLTPRQPLSPTPYALYALQASNADALDGLHAGSFLTGTSFLNASYINSGSLGNNFYNAYANLNSLGYLGDAAGDLARNNGTLQATLNSDLLDGLHASSYLYSGSPLNASDINAGTLGNNFFDAYSNLGAAGYLGDAAGDLARNNGTLQATLNADLLDGSHVGDFALTSHDHWGASWGGTGTGLEVSGGTTGLSGSGSSYGVYGTGGTYGVWASGITGVYGTGTNIGVQGAGNTYGLYGFGPTGVYGASTVTDQPGIHGEASGGPGTNYAGLFDGNVHVNGSLGITSTSLVTNLNADLLDGKHASDFILSTHNHWGQTWTGTGTGLILNGGATGLSGTGAQKGVFGYGSGDSGVGVVGESSNYVGVSGSSVNGVMGNSVSNGGKAIWGVAYDGPDSDYAGYFDGNVQVNGSLGITSTSLVTNLNADQLDGLHSTSFLTTTSSLNATNINAGTLGTGYYSSYSDLGAEGYLGNAAGDLALNNGTLQATLNADLLDGYTSGNATGNIPISNGTVNINLNADQLDGIHASALNVDRLDNYHAGNATANVPVNNGTVNTSLNADLLDGNHASAFVPAAQNVVIVAKSGGHFTTITAALANITDASDTNRYLIYVAPGVYTEQVTMKPYVDIEGAGELVTKITFPGSSSFTGTLLGANNAELRFLTVENTGGNLRAISIYNDGASPRLLHVTARALGGTSISTAVYNQFSSSTVTDVTASALGGASNHGMFNYESSPTINNSSISASGGSSNCGIGNYAGSGSYTVQVNNSQISGSTTTITTTPYYTTRVGTSQLSGGAIATGGGTVSCVGVYDENYASAGYTTCP